MARILGCHQLPLLVDVDELLVCTSGHRRCAPLAYKCLHLKIAYQVRQSLLYQLDGCLTGVLTMPGRNATKVTVGSSCAMVLSSPYKTESQ